MSKILITGAGGFVGRNLVEAFDNTQYEIVTFKSTQYDLCDQDQTRSLFIAKRPDIVIHLAAEVGGIYANSQRPAEFIYNNLVMGCNVIHMSYVYGVRKLVMLSSVCGYPKYAKIPFREHDIWNGYPEETNAPYGIAKKTLAEMIIAYHKQYEFNGVNLVPTNLMGKYDNFDPNTSHVIPALILKVDHAIKNNLNSITVWGTGNASRDFLYVQDCCKAIICAMESHNDPYLINIGSGKETTISTVVKLICEIMEYKGEIIWDFKKPDGQPRRCLDISRAKKLLNFEPSVSLRNGLVQTIQWYKETYAK